MSIHNLVDYLSTMGRCGAHFSLHSHITNHSVECRRTAKALELMEPHIKRGYNYEGVFYKSDAEDIDGSVAWHFATHLIESINGGLHYGPDGVYMELPELIGKMLDGGFHWETKEASEMISKSQSVATYQRWLKQCLELRYDWIMAPDLYLNELYAAGLVDDPPINYEDY